MTMQEILEALKEMKNEERFIIIETAARLMREEAEQKAQWKAEMKRQMAEAAKEVIPNYLPGGDLANLLSPDSKPYYESEEEYPSEEVKANA